MSEISSITCGLKVSLGDTDLWVTLLGGAKALRMSSFVTFSKLFNLSESGFPHVKNGYTDVSISIHQL